MTVRPLLVCGRGDRAEGTRRWLVGLTGLRLAGDGVVCRLRVLRFEGRDCLLRGGQTCAVVDGDEHLGGRCPERWVNPCHGPELRGAGGGGGLHGPYDFARTGPALGREALVIRRDLGNSHEKRPYVHLRALGLAVV